MTLEEVTQLFTDSGFKVTNFQKIINGYWPLDACYDVVRDANPWWSVETTFGKVALGWRKRVIAIDWVDLPYRGSVTSDSVTQDSDLVHAHSLNDAVKYLTQLRIGCEDYNAAHVVGIDG